MIKTQQTSSGRLLLRTLDGHVYLRLFIILTAAFSSQLVALQPCQAQLSFAGAVYHEATNVGIEGNSTRDRGGAVFMFVRNVGPTTQTFTNGSVTVNGSPLETVNSFDWSRIWPLSVDPGEVVSLTVKGHGGPFQAGQPIDLSLTSESGDSVSVSNFTLTTPKLRVGNVIPGHDRTKSYVYLRNDDTTAYTIEDLFLNENVTSQSRFVGGTTSVGPGEVKIIEVDHHSPQPLLKNMAVRVVARNNDTQQSITTGAPVRLTEPFLPTGPYSSNANREEAIMEDLRLTYGHNLSWMPGRYRLSQSRYEKYGIRGFADRRLDFRSTGQNEWDLETLVDPQSGAVAPLFSLPSTVQDETNDPGIYAWYLKDEPDLNLTRPDRTPQAMWRLNETFWRNTEKPTYINLVSDNTVQRYGLIADHASIDHYMQFAPLNHGSTFFNTYHIDEALQYAESMKNNIEPLRMWWIAQGVSPGTWGNQPADWGIAVQFWSAVMGGAKGVVGFKYDAGQTMRTDYPSQLAMQTDLMHELQMVRNVVLYGEPLDNVEISASEDDMAARSIVSEHAVVVPVVNLTGTYETGLFGVGASVTFDTLQDEQVIIPIPDWISAEQVKEITPEGLVDVSHSQDGQLVTIPISTLRDRRLFLISELDNDPPAQITDFRLAERDPDDPNYTPPPARTDFLSWTEPLDNFGVHGYHVFENGHLVADVPTPALRIQNLDMSMTYTVRAYDAAGNLGPMSNIIGTLPELTGDYNGDGVVDAADYTVWRDNLGSNITLPGDTTPGSVTSADYDVWRSNFGNMTGDMSEAQAAEAAVPEPATGSILLLLVAAVGLSRAAVIRPR